MKWPAQVTRHQIHGHGRQHQNDAEPDAPVPMDPLPIGALAWMKFCTIGIFKPMVFFLCWFTHKNLRAGAPPWFSFMRTGILKVLDSI